MGWCGNVLALQHGFFDQIDIHECKFLAMTKMRGKFTIGQGDCYPNEVFFTRRRAAASFKTAFGLLKS